MVWDAEKRHQQVLGAAERLSFVEESALDERHHAVLGRLRQYFDYDDEPMFDAFFANLAHSPEFFACFADFGATISLHSALPVRLRELAILRTAWLHGAPYSWGEHVFSSRRGALNADDTTRVVEGSESIGWSVLEAAIVRAAEELHEDSMISDATWAILSEHLTEQQLLELPLVIGHYVTTAYLQNTLRSRLSDYSSGLLER